METEKTVQIGDYRVTTVITDEPWCVNCYIVEHLLSGELIVIDPGDNMDNIVEAVGQDKYRLKKILITHAHHDHVGAVAELHEHFEVDCYLHKNDQKLMRQASTYALVFAQRNIKPFDKCRLYEEKVLETDNQSIRIINTPGHTLGSVCYDFGNFVFTGDTVLHKYVGRTDTPGASADKLVESVEQLLNLLDDQVAIFPGHGQRWDMGSLRKWWQEVMPMPPEYKHFGEI